MTSWKNRLPPSGSYSRQQFYEIRRNFQTYGAEGLLDRLPGARCPHPNRVSAEIETAILEHALAQPCHGPLRVAQELMLRGIQVSSGGVRGVWQRHGLLTKQERLLRLEQATAERTLALSDEQIRLLERFSPEFRERPVCCRSMHGRTPAQAFTEGLSLTPAKEDHAKTPNPKKAA